MTSTKRETTAIGSDKTRSDVHSSHTTNKSPPSNETTTTKTKSTNNNESGDGCMDLDSEQSRSRESTSEMSIGEFLAKLGLDEADVTMCGRIFDREKIGMDVLAEMSHEQLKEIGVDAYGVRHKILRGLDQFYKSLRDPLFNAPATGSLVIELDASSNEYEMIRNEMLSSIRVHKDDCDPANNDVQRTYDVVKIEKIKNRKLWARFEHRRREIQEENGGHENERLLFHGSPYWASIVERGFDERHACIQGTQSKTT